MATKKSTQIWTVTFRVEARLSHNVAAATPEEAITKAREIKDYDVLTEFDDCQEIETVEVDSVWKA